MTRVLFLANGGKRAQLPLMEDCAARLRAAGLTVAGPLLGDATEQRRRIENEAAPGDIVLVGGGDGTLHGLLETLVAREVTLAVLPLGTANDFARSLGLPRDPLRAVEAVIAGRPRRISLGEIRSEGAGKLFHSVASLGLGVTVTNRLDAAMKRRWGRLAYARALLSCLTRLHSFSVQVTADGRLRRLRSIQIGVANGDYQGGGLLPVAPGPTLSERELLLYSLPHRPVRTLLFLALLAKLRLHELAQDVTYLRGREIAIATRRPQRIIADGERVGRTPATFRIHVEALTVMVPADHEEPVR